VGFVVTGLAEGDLVGDAVDGTYEGSFDGASDEHGLLVPAAVGEVDKEGAEDIEGANVGDFDGLEVGDWALQQQEKQQLPSLLVHAADVAHEQSQVQPYETCYNLLVNS